MSNLIQKTIDGFWQATLFQILPKKVSPNWLTIFRLIMIPVTLLLIAEKIFVWALVCFLISALTDTIDGSLARVRKKISIIGKFLDPIADKLLSILTLSFLALFYSESYLILAVVLFDLLTLFSALLFLYIFQDNLPLPGLLGKSKVTLEMLGIIAIFLFLILSSTTAYIISLILLFSVLILEGIGLISYFILSVINTVQGRKL